MRRMRWIFLVAILLALLGLSAWLLLLQADPTPPHTADVYRVAAIMQTESNPFWAIAWEGLEKAAPSYQLSISKYPFSDRSETEALFETALLAQVDGIILCAPSELSERFSLMLEQARARGIALVFIDVDAGAQYGGVFIGANNTLGGSMLAEQVAQNLREGDVVCMLASEISTSQAIIERRQSFLGQAQSLGFAPAVTVFPFRSDDADSLMRLHNLLSSPQQPQHLVATSPGSTLSAAELVSLLGLSHHVEVYGFSETSQALAYVEDGTISTLFAQSNDDMGRLAAVALHQQLTHTAPVPREQYLPLYAITQENMTSNELAQRILHGK